MKNPVVEKFCDHTFSARDIAEIKEVVDLCSGISRTELANTVCELFDLRRANGKLKTVECHQFLEYLDSKGTISLPDRRLGTPTLPTFHGSRGQEWLLILAASLALCLLGGGGLL